VIKGSTAGDGLAIEDCAGEPRKLPRNTRGKLLAAGTYSYYWKAPVKDLKAGFSLASEALGPDLSSAVSRAHALNAELHEFRTSKHSTRVPRLPAFGTLRWMYHIYKNSSAWTKVSERTRPDYLHALRLVEEWEYRPGRRLGGRLVRTIDALTVDRLHDALCVGPRGRRARTANKAVQILARVWDVVQRLYPDAFSGNKPFRGVILTESKAKRPYATREEAFALHKALIAIGQPHLALAPLVCFELLQRPENVLAGHLRWHHYQPNAKVPCLMVEHHKTGVEVMMPLTTVGSDGNRHQLFPELCAYLDQLERLGDQIVLMKPRQPNRQASERSPRCFNMHYARSLVRTAARRAKLPSWLTLDACRHGGMTLLAEAGLTEEQEMSMSGHSTPDAKRRYVVKTRILIAAAVAKRHSFVTQQQMANPIDHDSEDSPIQ